MCGTTIRRYWIRWCWRPSRTPEPGVTEMPQEPAAAVAERTPVTRTRAAARMQRSRKRHREGISCYTIQLRDNEIEALVDLGLLPSAERANRPSVIRRSIPSSTRLLEWCVLRK